MEAPDKIYASVDCSYHCGGEYTEITAWGEDGKDEYDTEYIQTDVVLKKVEEYLYKELHCGRIECGDIAAFINDFKAYMKGE